MQAWAGDIACTILHLYRRRDCLWYLVGARGTFLAAPHWLFRLRPV